MFNIYLYKKDKNIKIKLNKMINEQLKSEIFRLINLKRTTGKDVQSMIDIIKANIDGNFNVCKTCIAQIKYAQRILLNFYNSQQVEEQQIVLETPPQKEPGCPKCKKKTINKK
jgi:hypothetical protein